jgi:hypothetical protein
VRLVEPKLTEKDQLVQKRGFRLSGTPALSTVQNATIAYRRYMHGNS